MREANTFDLSLLVLLAIIWGSSFFNIKIATYSYDPFTLALVRVIFASIPLLILCKINKIKIEAFSKNWSWYALIGLCNIAIPFVLIAIGTAKINSYLAAILMSTTPLSGSILAHFFTKDEKLSYFDKATLCFALAKSYTDQKNHKESSNYFIKGNENMFKTYRDANINNQIKLFQKIKNEFKLHNFENKNQNDEPRLIFIVGLPRSGTTLTHQIISSHSKVYGAGELPVLKNAFLKNNQLELKENALIKNLNVEEFSSKILSKFMIYDKNSIILDKAPLNFMWIGHIHLLFPDAKIIHINRNIKDTALSIYKNMFDASALTWTYNQEHLIKFIELYKDLMKFWKLKLPNLIYECDYEKLVNDQENETKKLIKFCNLDWEDNCIDHTKNKTGIKTVSLAQARKPVYKSSINLYETYIEYLPFLNQIKE